MLGAATRAVALRSNAGEVIPYYYSHCIRTPSPFPPIFRLFALSGPQKSDKGRREYGNFAKNFSFSFLPDIIEVVFRTTGKIPVYQQEGILLKRIFTKALCLVCAGALALSLAACGGKADSAASSTASSSALGSASDYDYQNFNYSDGLDEKGYWEGIRALDYVTLPEDFASVAIKRSDIEPTSEEVEEQISNLLSQYSSTEHITDRAAADGDTVNINYVGSVNNVEFTGGSAENYDLTLGSGTFIDGFEDQIIGHKPGETFDVNVTFPDGYSDSTDASGNAVKLSGQKAVFTVTLNYISESVLPELTDSWVASTFGTSNNIYTVEALRAYYQDQLYTSNLNTAVMDYLLENSTFKSIPQQVMDYQVNQCLNYYSTLAGYYGYDLDGLVQNLLGYENTDAMLAHLESNLEDYSKEALLYQAVAESLDIAPTQEQIDTYSAYADTYGQNYCTMVDLMDAVTSTLTSGAVVS